MISPALTRVVVGDLAALKTERATGTAYTTDKLPTIDSANYIVNYFEFISVGVLDGDLDGTLIEHTLRSIFVNWFEHLEPIIYDAQIEDSGAKNERIFKSYIELVSRYRSLKP